MTTAIEILILINGLFVLSDVLPERHILRRVAVVGRVQQAFIPLVLLMTAWLVGVLPALHPLAIAIGLFSSGWSFYRIRRYLPWSKCEVPHAPSFDWHILALNVRQKNGDHERAKAFILEQNPDIIVLTEIDDDWYEALKELEQRYAFSLVQAQSNTYGIWLLSKFQMDCAVVNHLVKEDIPSIHAQWTYCGTRVHLFALHPEPPMSQRKLLEKDLEISKLAERVKNCDGHIIVCGDLNDVGWSHATEHMLAETRFKDPRKGRGFYNTYNAHIPLLRYPIDHFFLSDDFTLSELKVHAKVGSDHYPVSASIGLMKKR